MGNLAGTLAIDDFMGDSVWDKSELSLKRGLALTELFQPSYTNHSLKYRIWVQPYPVHETDPDFTLEMILICLNQKPSLDSWA